LFNDSPAEAQPEKPVSKDKPKRKVTAARVEFRVERIFRLVLMPFWVSRNIPGLKVRDIFLPRHSGRSVGLRDMPSLTA
jgi:hypothetical protein